MTPRKSSPASSRDKSALPARPSPCDLLQALLQTVRCIIQHEDSLCEILHESRKSPGLAPQLSAELRSVLDRMPSHDYLDDFLALRELLGAPTQAPRAPSSARTSNRAKQKPSARARTKSTPTARLKTKSKANAKSNNTRRREPSR